MKITCPVCATSFPIEAGINDAQARKFSQLMGEVPPQMAHELIHYLTLFKPKQQGLRWARAVKILNELIEDIKREKIKHNGRDWSAPPAIWKEAIEVMLSKQHELDLPMANHNYLYKIIAGLSDKIEAAQERITDQSRMHRQVNQQSQGDPKLRRLLDDKTHYESLLEIKPGNKQAQQALDDVNEKIKHYRP